MLDRPTLTAPSPSSVEANHFFDSYRLYRAYCEHENSLISDRMNLLMALQMFLFGLSGFLLKKGDLSDALSVHARELLMAIAVTGIFASFSACFAVGAAWWAQSALEENWKNNRTVSDQMKAVYPALNNGGSLEARLFGKAMFALPASSFCVWIYWFHML